MIRILKYLCFFLIQGFGFGSIAQNISVLSSGGWYKLSVTQEAVYKIDYEYIKNLGLNPETINPRNIQIFTSHNAMLPQSNSAQRIEDLKEIAIYFFGDEDGVFNMTDYIAFYGQGPDSYSLLPDDGIFYYQNNIYSNKNFYYLTVGVRAGKRMETPREIKGIYPIVNEFDDFSRIETQKSNILHSGRKWYGEKFGVQKEYTIRFDASNIVKNSPIYIVYNVLVQTYNPASLILFLNGIKTISTNLPTIVDSRWELKGVEKSDTIKLNSGLYEASIQPNQEVKLEFVKATSGLSVAYIDYIMLQTKRQLALYQDQTIFHSLKSLEQPVTKFVIDGMPENGMVWNITDPFNSKIQTSTISQGQCSFVDYTSQIKKYVAISNQNYLVPDFDNIVENQNLHSTLTPDLVIVTAPEFMIEAQRLATYRESKNSISVVVVSTTQIYNEFSGGKQDVTAIRDFVKYLYDNDSRLKNLLLFGRGSFDYLNHIGYGKNFVPIYESMNSLNPVGTYSSDDYYGYLENHEGDWSDQSSEQPTMEIGVGRLPVTTIVEAKNIVDKIIQYENQTWGTWRKKILFVADDGDSNLHQSQADIMAESIEINFPDFNVNKLYLDSYPKTESSLGTISPKAKSVLNSKISDGVLIVNYNGHGSEHQLMSENIMDVNSLAKWKNAPNYPFLVTATCEFGRNDDPSIISLGENTLIKKNGGSIGLITSTRPVYASSNFILNRAFYQALFVKDKFEYRDLGSIFRDTKNNSFENVKNRSFSLLADPSMKLNIPPPRISITSITNLSSGNNKASAVDTLKAFSKVRISGEIITSNSFDPNYNGIIQISLFGKPNKERVVGQEKIPFEFLLRNNSLFQGQASVTNGKFEVDFIMTSMIDSEFYKGKLSLYSYPNSDGHDVSGSHIDVVYGGKELNISNQDFTHPEIKLYMGDTTFTTGSIVNRNSKLIALFKDDSGINISNYNPNHNIVINLDDSLIIVNSYYQSNIDNYTIGKIEYPFFSIEPGKHTLSLSVSDIFENRHTESIDFYVSKDEGIEISKLLASPNPLPIHELFTVYFSHNRSGDDLEAEVAIHNIMGQPITSSTYLLENSYQQVEINLGSGNNWNGTQLSIGMYVVRLNIRSLFDNSQYSKSKIFIITD